MKEKTMHFSYKNIDVALHYRTVLVEKTEKTNTTISLCCTINGVSVFNDPYCDKQSVLISRNGMNVSFVVTGIECSRIKNDSTIIELILKTIQHYSKF